MNRVENGPKDDIGQNKPFEIKVIYNGVTKETETSKAEPIGALLQRVLAMFGSLPAPHTLALYDAEGNELKDTSSVKDAKLKKDDCLQLRPSTVKAG